MKTTSSDVKTLLVMRHAKSSWDNPHDTDHMRPLNERGDRDAPLMAARIAELGLPLDAVVTSDATRAMQTASYVAASTLAPMVATADLYHAGVSEWQQVVAGFSDDWTGVVGVAHNPGVAELLERMGGGGDVPSATVLHLQLPSWDRLLDAELVNVLRVRDF